MDISGSAGSICGFWSWRRWMDKSQEAHKATITPMWSIRMCCSSCWRSRSLLPGLELWFLSNQCHVSLSLTRLLLRHLQEGKDQALYFDAKVLDAQRRRHDIRGCRCRFLVRYSHDQSEVGRSSFKLSLTIFLPVSSVLFHGLRIWSKTLLPTHLFFISFPLSQQEIVPLRKICRRPETDYRLQQLHSSSNDFGKSNQLQKPAPDAAAAPQSSASVPIVVPEKKDPSLISASATSVQPGSNAATVPAGSA